MHSKFRVIFGRASPRSARNLLAHLSLEGLFCGELDRIYIAFCRYKNISIVYSYK